MRTRDMLPADARLDQPVTMDEAGITLPDTLGKLSRGIVLTCDFECRTQKLQLCVVKRPLRQVMNALADLLPGTWQMEKDGGYKLTMSAQAVKRRRAWWNMYLELRERTQKEAAANLLSAMQTPPDPNGAKFKETDGGGRPPGMPTRTQGRLFFNALPPDLQEKIAHSVNEAGLFSPDGGGGYEDQESATVVAFRSLPIAAQSIIRAVRPNIPDNTWIRFTSDGIEANANFFSPKGQLTASTCTLRSDKNNEAQSALQLDHSGLVRIEEFLNSQPDTPAMPRVHMAAVLLPFLAYQKSRVWKNAEPTQPVPPSFAPPRRADLLYRLHNRKNMEYVADYYSTKARPANATDLADNPRDTQNPFVAVSHLEAQLDTLAAQTDSSWEKSGDLYLFRDNRWYRDDLIEVPAALANTWLAARRTNTPPPDEPQPISPLTSPPPAGAQIFSTLGGASVPGGLTLAQALDWKARFAANLTRWQIANGLQWLADETYARALQDEKKGNRGSVDVSRYFPFNGEAENTQREFNLMRFYASLRPEQRAALVAGTLKCDTLNVQQQTLALVVAPMLLPALDAAPASDITIHIGRSGSLDGKLTLLYDFPDK